MMSSPGSPFQRSGFPPDELILISLWENTRRLTVSQISFNLVSIPSESLKEQRRYNKELYRRNQPIGFRPGEEAFPVVGHTT
jgi:hypothetical protein